MTSRTGPAEPDKQTSGLKVLMAPDWRGPNPYFDLLSQSLEACGCKTTFAHYPKGYFKLTKLISQHSDIDVIHIHWTQGLFSELFWSKGVSKSIIKRALYFLDIGIVALSKIKIIWTVHNIYEHETKDESIERKCRRILFKRADHVIVHSASAKTTILEEYGLADDKKVEVIPHGNYLHTKAASTSPLMSREALGLPESCTTLLFFGNIRRYKGLEVLVRSFLETRNPSIRLLIAGHAMDYDLSLWLRQKASSDPRIHIHDHFIPEEHVSSYFEVADCVILPFTRTLTSGSAILAMGFSKGLILPRDAEVLDLPRGGTLYFSTGSELRDILQRIDTYNFEEAGRLNYDFVKKLEWTRVARDLYSVYIGKPNDVSTSCSAALS